MPEISWIHNVFGFRNKIQNISDHPVTFFWKLGDFEKKQLLLGHSVQNTT